MSNPPTTLGQYQIIREIARSNDIVYEAYDPLMNRRVAVKELAVPAGSTPQQKEERISRFKREAQAAGTLNHAHIMTVFSFAEESGRTFMAMEYLDGSNLRNEIDTKGFIPVDRAVEIILQVLDGLGHAHTKGVIHRDIKPDNIQILSSGNVKITDFGIARLTFQPNLTMDGQVFGTPSYMSPEQVVGKDIDARSDLFSVATVLYEMIGGQKPFSGDSVVSITYAIMNNEPPRPQQCPDALWSVLHKALDKSPAMRYPSAAALADAISNAMKPDALVFAPPPQQTVQNPYAQPQQPSTSAPTYIFNPYINQSAPTNPPPVQHAYPNPYAQPHNTMPPPGFMPVYYPPPPRQPLVKPETADFLKKLLITLIVMGTLFALVFVGIQAIARALQNQQALQQDEGILDNVNLDPQVPVGERIESLQRARAVALSPSAKDQIDQKLAITLAERGAGLERQGRLADAELDYLQAIEHDGRNASIRSKLAKLYENQASAASTPTQWAPLALKSAENWAAAWTYEVDPNLKQDYGVGAATGYYNVGLFMYESEEPRADVREVLYRAVRTAPPEAEITRNINQLLDRVR